MQPCLERNESNPLNFNDIYISIPASDKGKRLDVAIAEHTPLSRRRIRKAIDDGGVYVNKRRCRKAGLQLSGGERIRIVTLDGETPAPFSPEQVLWRQDDLLLLNKKSGQYAQEALHRSRGTLPLDIADWLGLRGEAAKNVRPVHRLDRGTSGLMLYATSSDQLHRLQALWGECAEKEYLAVVEPAPSWQARRITHPIGKRRNRHGCYRVDKEGRACDSEAEVLDRRENRALLKLVPHTGRTHQLRVHLAAEGCPILGDARYGGRPHARLMLHARRLIVRPPALDRTHQWEIAPDSNGKEDWAW